MSSGKKRTASARGDNSGSRRPNKKSKTDVSNKCKGIGRFPCRCKVQDDELEHCPKHVALIGELMEKECDDRTHTRVMFYFPPGKDGCEITVCADCAQDEIEEGFTVTKVPRENSNSSDEGSSSESSETDDESSSSCEEDDESSESSSEEDTETWYVDGKKKRTPKRTNGKKPQKGSRSKRDEDFRKKIIRIFNNL